jgi:hypothetical protein
MMEKTITRQEITSPKALQAFATAEYRLRHSMGYAEWPDRKRLAYCLKAAFDAACNEKTEPFDHSADRAM